MKLTAAKCPSCGANLKVDRNEESTVCKYCGSSILIEDAVEKYKLEISGKIKVSGIKDNDDRLEDAKNYLKLKEYKNANTVLNTIINEEPFNVEAFILCIKSYLGEFDSLYSEEDYETDSALNKVFWNDIDFVLSKYNRLKSIDEKEKYKTKLKEEIKVIDKMQKEKEKLAKDLELCQEIDEMIEEITAYKFNSNIAKAAKRDYRKINKVIIAYFNNTLGFDILKVPDNVRCIYRNLEIKYYDSSSRFRDNKITKYSSLKEVYNAIEKSKQDIKNKIEKAANMSSPIGMIKNIFNKNK